jgi:hypothetical protein
VTYPSGIILTEAPTIVEITDTNASVGHPPGRLLSEDPVEFDGGVNFYVYVGNGPTNFVDSLGLYTVKPGVPAPSPALDKLLTCMDGCAGVPILVTATLPRPGEQHQDIGHAAGTSVDIHPPAGIPTSKVFCCAGLCGAAFGVDEGPGGIKAKFTKGFNYHLQLVPPKHPRPGVPNALISVEVVRAAPSNVACNLPQDLQREIASKYPGARLVSLADLEEDDRKFFQADHNDSCLASPASTSTVTASPR